MFAKKSPFKIVDAFQPRRAFTLVEMLAVISIIVLLLLVTVPAFRGFNQSQSRRGAVSNLMGVLDHARMMAVSDGTATYVVFATPTKQINANLWGRGYAIFQDSDNVNFNLVQRTGWMYLPTGIGFLQDAGTHSITNRAPGATDPAFPVTGAARPANATGGTTAQLPYWKFDSTGAVDRQTTPDDLRLLLFPGFFDETGKTVFQGQGGSNGTVTASQLEEIDVNPVTGRAKYNVDPSNNLTPTPNQS